MTLKKLLENSVNNFGLKTALSCVNGAKITYAVMYNRVQALSQLLRNKDVQFGDRVAILGENSPNWGIAYFAITGMGGVTVPIQPEFHPNEIRHILRHSGARGLFVSRRLIEKLPDEEIDSLKFILFLDDFQAHESNQKRDLFQEFLEKSEKEFDKIKRAARQMTGKLPENGHPQVKEDDLAAIVYTSGTTGHAKGVMLSHKNIVSNALGAKGFVDITDKDRLLSILPLAHTYETTLGLIAPIAFGASVAYLDKTPTPRVLLPALKKVKPTIMLSVPLVIEKIYKAQILPQLKNKRLTGKLYRYGMVRRQLHKIAGRKLLKFFGGELKAFCIGGAALLPEVELFLREARFPYAVGYGLTETAPLVTGSAPFKTKFRSVGKALDGVQIKISSSDTGEAAGEVCVKGNNVMPGYYNDTRRTQEVFSDDRWLKTGDLGQLDEEGYLFIKGRLKTVIIGSNGKNIYPEQIEALINEALYVMESLVFEDNNRLCARVYPDYDQLENAFSEQDKSNSELEAKINELLETLRIEVNQKLPDYARLNRIIEHSEPFEKTPTQKIKRYLYIT